MKDQFGTKLDNVTFLDEEFDEFDLEIVTSNYTEHRVCLTITEHSEEDVVETLLTDDDIDRLIQALESAKDLRIARIQQGEPVYKESC